MKQTLLAMILILSTSVALQAQSEFSPQAMLKPKTSGLFSIPPNLTAREAFDNLGSKAGINMVYIPAFKQDAVIPVRIDGQDFFDAMKRLSAETKTFWFAWDSKTVILTPDTQQYRRDLEPNTYKIIYLPNTKPEKINEIAVTIRSRGEFRGIFQAPEGHAMVVKGLQATVASAEKILSEVSGEALPLRANAPVAFPENDTYFELIAENGKARRVLPPTQSQLEKNLSDTSIDTTQPVQMAYEDLISRAGLNVIFDRNMREKASSRFHVDGETLADALDLLALQTSTVWQPVSESTIYVMDDNQQNRRDRLALSTKVIFLPELITVYRLNELMNVLRSSLALRGIFQNEERKAFAIRDTPLRVALTEKIVTDLVKDLGKPTSVAIDTGTSSFYGENGWVLGQASAARPNVEVKLRNKTTVRLNETTKGAFEALAGLAGLEVSFDKSFIDTPQIRFNANNVDILEAMDLLSWQTRSFWKVVDLHTIRVIPDSQASQRQQDPLIQKTIVPTNFTSRNGVLNILRTTFALRNVSLDDKGNILIRDTADNVAMAEKFVEILGKGVAQ
jgi:hypothetical protein